ARRIVPLVTGINDLYVIDSRSMQIVRSSDVTPANALRLRAGTIVPAVLLTLPSGAALADQKATTGKLYKWVDENGIVHYGDHVPAEYSKSERQVVNAKWCATQKICE